MRTIRGSCWRSKLHCRRSTPSCPPCSGAARRRRRGSGRRPPALRGWSARCCLTLLGRSSSVEGKTLYTVISHLPHLVEGKQHDVTNAAVDEHEDVLEDDDHILLGAHDPDVDRVVVETEILDVFKERWSLSHVTEGLTFNEASPFSQGVQRHWRALNIG